MSRNIEELPGAASVDRNRLNQWLDFRPAYGRSLMDELFNLLEGMYGKKWSSNFTTEEAVENWRKVWATGFELKGITPKHIKGGLDQCVDMYKWSPSLPEFIAACRAAVVRPEHQTIPHDRRVGRKITEEEMAHNRKRVREILENFGKKIP